MRLRTALLLVTAMWASVAVHAEVYTWRDAQGKLHFSDKKPTNTPYEKKEIVVKTQGTRFATTEDITRGKKKMQEIRRSNRAAASRKQWRKATQKRQARARKATEARRQFIQKQNDYLQEERAAVRQERERFRRQAQGY